MNKSSTAVLSAVVAAVVSSATVAAQPTQRELPWIGAPKGICITNVAANSDGLFVQFVTDLPPPYRVGIHVPQELGLARTWPVDYADVTGCSVYIPGKFLDDNLFVQVYKPGDPSVCPANLTRKMTATERAEFSHKRQAVIGRRPRYVQDPTWYDNPPVRTDLSGIAPSEFELIGDRTWGNFLYSTNTDLRFSVDMINRQRPGSRGFSHNTNTLSFAARDRDPKVGTGFRILVVETEDPDTGEPAMACLAAAAYSARTNMSQAVLLRRGVFCLSAHGGWKYSVDWEGIPVMVPCTNAIPDRVYEEGL